VGVLFAFVLGCSGDPEDKAPVIGSGAAGGTTGGGGNGGGGGMTGGASGSSGRMGTTGGSGGASGSSSGSGGASGTSGTSGMAGRSGSSGAGGSSGSSGAGGSSGSGCPTGCSGGSAPVDPPMVGGCEMFPPDDAWNTDIFDVPADAGWTTRLMNMVGETTQIHPDWGGDATELYGIPVGVVPENQAPVPVTFDYYPDESDPGPYPFPSPADALIEGGNATSCDGDCHLLVVQQGSCQLYEGWICQYKTDGWHCANGAHWDLTRNSYGQRTRGYTSADAAGLPIAPGVVRYDEVRAGAVNHAIRFTTECTRANFVNPATHYAVPGGCDANDPNSPPMGLRVRLKPSFDASGMAEGAQVIVEAMKHYGMILADNGSNFYFQGEANLGWTENEIEDLKSIPAGAFEVIEVPPLEE
jgi:hypothetical protein